MITHSRHHKMTADKLIVGDWIFIKGHIEEIGGIDSDGHWIKFDVVGWVLIDKSVELSVIRKE